MIATWYLIIQFSQGVHHDADGSTRIDKVWDFEVPSPSKEKCLRAAFGVQANTSPVTGTEFKAYCRDTDGSIVHPQPQFVAKPPVPGETPLQHWKRAKDNYERADAVDELSKTHYVESVILDYGAAEKELEKAQCDKLCPPKESRKP